MPRVCLLAACLLGPACLVLSGCSPARLATGRMAATLSETATAYGSDNDPEFVRLAAPATLKMVEMLLEAQPAHDGLLLTACSGFTQYAYGFIQAEVALLPAAEKGRIQELRARARTMYDRARGYCWRALETRHPGVQAQVVTAPAAAVAAFEREDVPALYWLGVSWAGSLGLDPAQLQRLSELVAVRVLLGRALVLDEAWREGALHEAFIALDGMPVLLGGSAARARQHLDRAVALSDGQSAFAYVTFAAAVSVRAGDRAEFERLLQASLAIDPATAGERRLATLIAQREARGLLARADALFPAR